MMKTKSWLLFLIIVLVTVLSACSAPVENTIAVERRPEYGSITEVTGMANVDVADMSLEELVRFMDLWMNQKYVVYEKGANAPSSATKITILIIPYGKVGVVQFGGLKLILPPRAYDGVPSEDDEIRVVNALCVGPGYIAWKLNFEGQRELRTARQECYLEPAEGWVPDTVLEIKPGQIAWRLNGSGEIVKLTEAKVYGNELTSDWRVEPYLSVSNGNMAFRLLADGSYAFKGPGQYSAEIASEWTVINAVFVDQMSFGKYLEADGSITHIDPGWYFNLLPSNLEIYSANQLRYRTLSIGHLLDQIAIQDYLSPDSNACQSILCDTTIDRVVIKGSSTTSDFNVDVLYHFDSSPAFSNEYLEIGGMMRAVQDHVATPTRNIVRIVCSGSTREELKTQTGAQTCAQLILDALRLHNKDLPVVIDSVNIRGMNFNDQELVAAEQAAEIDKQKAEARIEIAELEQEALYAEAKLREAQQAEFEYKLGQLEAYLDMIARSAQNGLSVGHLMILMQNNQLPFEFVIGPDGTLTLPNNPDVVITVPMGTPAP